MGRTIVVLTLLTCCMVGGLMVYAAEDKTEKKVERPRTPRTRRGRRPRPGEPIKWVVPLKKKIPGVQHGTFHSKSMNTKVGFNVYTPPDYATSKDRYPVIYWLHGIRGNESKGLDITQKLNKAILAGRVPPMIMVLPNGGQFTFYCDSADGKILSETMIIKELIPFIDAKYRTIASRKSRAIEGSSMGAFGAAHLGLKYQDVFCSMLSGSTAIFDQEDFATRLPEVYKMMFNSDPKICKRETPYALARKNADVIRRDLAIVLAVGTKDWAYPYGEKLHKCLEELKIPHRYEVMEGVGHGRGGYYRTLGDGVFNFHAKNFGLKRPATTPSIPPAKNTKN